MSLGFIRFPGRHEPCMSHFFGEMPPENVGQNSEKERHPGSAAKALGFTFFGSI